VTRPGLDHIPALTRLAARISQTESYGQTTRAQSHHASTPAHAGKRRVMVIGAGSAGSQLIRELQQNHNGRTPVVIIDDNRQTHHLPCPRRARLTAAVRQSQPL